MIKRKRARAARAMATTMRVADDKEGKDDKAMAMATRIADDIRDFGSKVIWFYVLTF
jgi:hypothetical protein